MKPGIILQGKYRLISPLGEGGMAAVWRAEHLGLGAPIAVKLMHPELAERADLRARFDEEAKTAASLRSPHIVQVFDFGFDSEAKMPFMVMELLEGESLGTRLERTGPLPPAELARIVTDVARALSRAHEINVIHRDLKPENIFLVRNAESEIAKVLDFGIAKSSVKPTRRAATATGVLLGTPQYMSPEQIRSSKSVDYRTDLWSLGVIVVECLTGQRPFESDNLPGLALQICSGHPTKPSLLGPVPVGVDAWFQRAAAANPVDRFESAAQMAAELRELCGVAPAPQTVAGTTPPREPAPPVVAVTEPGWDPPYRSAQLPSTVPLSHSSAEARLPSSRRWPRWAAAGAVALLSGGGLYLRLARRDIGPPPPLPRASAAQALPGGELGAVKTSPSPAQENPSAKLDEVRLKPVVAPVEQTAPKEPARSQQTLRRSDLKDHQPAPPSPKSAKKTPPVSKADVSPTPKPNSRSASPPALHRDTTPKPRTPTEMQKQQPANLPTVSPPPMSGRDNP